MRIESEGCRLETATAENHTEEPAPEQQKQEPDKAQREVRENCDPSKNLKEGNSAMAPCEEKTKNSLRDSQEGD